MCNLYRMRRSNAEVGLWSNAMAQGAPNYAEEVYPGYPGLVITSGEVRAMTWGFPLAMKSKRTGKPLKPKPINNAREDRLATPFWRDSFARRRCLIPVTAWAEAEGETGRMTRTWYSLPDEELFAVAGIWRATEEWGEAYSMVMVDGYAQMAEVHDRMPTILQRQDWDQWLNGKPSEAFELVRTCTLPLSIERTSEPWFKRRETP